MGLVSKTKTWADNDLVIYTDMNANFDTLYTLVNGNIDNNNINASAAIDVSKLTNVVSTNTAQSVSGKKTFTATAGTIVADSDGSTITFDMSTGNFHKVTLAGNRTLAISNVATGQPFTLRLTQDGTGSRIITWFTTITWLTPGGTAPVLQTAANKIDLIGFVCTGAGTYDGFPIASGG